MPAFQIGGFSIPPGHGRIEVVVVQRTSPQPHGKRIKSSRKDYLHLALP